MRRGAALSPPLPLRAAVVACLAAATGALASPAAPDVWTVLDTLDARLDRSLTFDRRVSLGAP